ncbi:hypothetical protein, partial [Brachybacterium muris]
ARSAVPKSKIRWLPRLRILTHHDPPLGHLNDESPRLVPGLLGLYSDARARRAARLETIADLAGELLEGCERYRAAAQDVAVLTELTSLEIPGLTSGRSPVRREHDDERARLRALAVRIRARDTELGKLAQALVVSARQDSWGGERDRFVKGLSGKVR